MELGILAIPGWKAHTPEDSSCIILHKVSNEVKEEYVADSLGFSQFKKGEPLFIHQFNNWTSNVYSRLIECSGRNWEQSIPFPPCLKDFSFMSQQHGQPRVTASHFCMSLLTTVLNFSCQWHHYGKADLKGLFLLSLPLVLSKNNPCSPYFFLQLLGSVMFWRLKSGSMLDRQKWSGQLWSSGLYLRMLALPAQVQGYDKLTAMHWRDSHGQSVPFWVARSHPACHCSDEERTSDGCWVIYFEVFIYIFLSGTYIIDSHISWW